MVIHLSIVREDVAEDVAEAGVVIFLNPLPEFHDVGLINAIDEKVIEELFDDVDDVDLLDVRLFEDELRNCCLLLQVSCSLGE